MQDSEPKHLIGLGVPFRHTPVSRDSVFFALDIAKVDRLLSLLGNLALSPGLPCAMRHSLCSDNLAETSRKAIRVGDLQAGGSTTSSREAETEG